MTPTVPSSSSLHTCISLARTLTLMTPLMMGLVGCGGAEEALEAEQLSSTQQEVKNGAINAACGNSVTVRNAPSGSTIGTMYTNSEQGISKFYVQSTTNGWSYGYSYSLGIWGYAVGSYLAGTYSESGTPGQLGYHWSCTRPDGSILGGGID